MNVRWRVPVISQADGYATVAAEMRAALGRAGATLADDADVTVTVGLPDKHHVTGSLQPLLAWHTMLEVDRLPDGWADVLNECGLVWTPSTWVRDLFGRCGVTAPMGVVGYGVDPDVFHANGRVHPGDGPLRFGVWGDALRTRKHVELGVRAWLAAGVPDATLEVKITDTTAAPYWIDEAGRELRNVSVFRGAWPRERIADWLRSLDVLVYLSGGEGFGLMPLEAMACGTAVICAYNTGMTDYLTAGNALLVIRHKPEPAPTYTAFFGPEFKPQQLLPDFDEAVAVIRWAGDHRANGLRAIGKQAAKDAGRRTWDASGRALYGLLHNHMGAIV